MKNFIFYADQYFCGDYVPLIFPMLQICLDVNRKTADLRKLELRGAEQLSVSIILIL